MNIIGDAGQTDEHTKTLRSKYNNNNPISDNCIVLECVYTDTLSHTWHTHDSADIFHLSKYFIM